MSTSVSVKIALKQLPMPTQASVPHSSREQDLSCTLDKIAEYCSDVDTPMADTKYQWQYLKRLFKVLSAKAPDSLSTLEKTILQQVTVLIMKYVEFDAELAPLIDGANLIAHASPDKE